MEDLNSNDFDTREKVSAELEAMGDLAGPALRAVLKGSPPAEVERRAKALLEKLERQEVPSAQVRPIRAILALETLGSQQARRLLEKLAGGAPEARSTKEAKAALDRLRKQARFMR